MSVDTLELVLAQTGGALQTSIEVACRIAGISHKTFRNLDSRGIAPFPAAPGKPRRVDVRDIAEYLDARRAGGAFRPGSTPRPAQQAAKSDATLPKRPRGRPRKYAAPDVQQQQEGGQQ